MNSTRTTDPDLFAGNSQFRSRVSTNAKPFLVGPTDIVGSGGDGGGGTGLG
jgi:hypothetical protein